MLTPWISLILLLHWKDRLWNILGLVLEATS